MLEKPVLIINGHNVSTKDFADRLASKLRHYDALHAKDDSTLDRAKDETVQTLILERIARDYAKKQDLSVSSEEIEAKAKEVRDKYPDEFAFRRALADENMPLETWKDQLEFSLLQKKIFAKIVEGQPEPSEAEMKEFYEANKAQFQMPARVRLRQIVLEKEDDAKRIMDELQDGKDLASLSKKFSIAPEGSNGGDTGWLDKGTLDIFDQALKMNVGARSKILKSPYGYHIYELIKKEPETRLSFPDAKAKIRAQLLERREQKAFTAWLESQVKKANVKRDDALIQAIKVTTRGN